MAEADKHHDLTKPAPEPPWVPNTTNMPRTLYERLDKAFSVGVPLTLVALVIFIIPGTGIIPADWRDTGLVLLFLFIPAVIILWQASIVLIVVLLGHARTVNSEVADWAAHGFYREGFEPKGYDLSQLECISNATVKKFVKRAKQPD